MQTNRSPAVPDDGASAAIRLWHAPHVGWLTDAALAAQCSPLLAATEAATTPKIKINSFMSGPFFNYYNTAVMRSYRNGVKHGSRILEDGNFINCQICCAL